MVVVGCVYPPPLPVSCQSPPPLQLRRGRSCSAGRARRVTRAGEGDRERGRLRALGEPRAAWNAATEPAPASCAGCSHARSACAASMRCPS